MALRVGEPGVARASRACRRPRAGTPSTGAGTRTRPRRTTTRRSAAPRDGNRRRVPRASHGCRARSRRAARCDHRVGRPERPRRRTRRGPRGCGARTRTSRRQRPRRGAGAAARLPRRAGPTSSPRQASRGRSRSRPCDIHCAAIQYRDLPSRTPDRAPSAVRGAEPVTARRRHPTSIPNVMTRFTRS